MLRQVDYLIFFSGLFGNADIVLFWKSLPISFVAVYHCRGSRGEVTSVLGLNDHVGSHSCRVSFVPLTP